MPVFDKSVATFGSKFKAKGFNHTKAKDVVDHILSTYNVHYVTTGSFHYVVTCTEAAALMDDLSVRSLGENFVAWQTAPGTIEIAWHTTGTQKQADFLSTLG